jgi:hypothetical protein
MNNNDTNFFVYIFLPFVAFLIFEILDIDGPTETQTICGNCGGAYCHISCFEASTGYDKDKTY